MCISGYFNQKNIRNVGNKKSKQKRVKYKKRIVFKMKTKPYNILLVIIMHKKNTLALTLCIKKLSLIIPKDKLCVIELSTSLLALNYYNRLLISS